MLAQQDSRQRDTEFPTEIPDEAWSVTVQVPHAIEPASSQSAQASNRASVARQLGKLLIAVYEFVVHDGLTRATAPGRPNQSRFEFEDPKLQDGHRLSGSWN